MDEPRQTTSDVALSPGGSLVAPSWGIRCGAVALLLGILGVFKLSVLGVLGHGFVGGASGDAGLYVWLFKSHVRGLFSTPWFETSGFYPYGQSLAWSDNFILPGIIGQGTAAIGISDTLSYNLIILGSTFLSGYCTFILAYRLTGRFWPALCAGVGFMTTPYIAGMQGHPQLIFTCFIPLGINALVSFLASSSVRNAFLYGVVLTAAFATAVYYAIFLVIAGVTLYLALMLVRPGGMPVSAHLRLGLGVALGAAPLLFLVPPYLGIAKVFGERNLYETFYFAASALSYLSAPRDNLLYGATSILSHDEAQLFPGLIMLLALPAALWLIAAGAATRCRLGWAVGGIWGLVCITSALAVTLQGPAIVYLRYFVALLSWGTIVVLALLLLRLGRDTSAELPSPPSDRVFVGIFLFLAAMGFFVSLGPLGNPEYGQLALGVHRVWYEFFPGFDSIRAVGRVGILTIFALCVLLALTLSHLERIKQLPRWVAAALCLGILIESYHTHTPIEPLPQSGAVYERLSSVAKPGDVAIMLPFSARLNERGQPASYGEFARRNIEYMLKLFPSGLQAVNGYSGQRTKIMREFPRQLAEFPDQRSVSVACSVAGLRYLVYASKGVERFDPTVFMQRVAKFPQQLTFLESDSEGNYLFELPCMTRIVEERELLLPGSHAAVVRLALANEGRDREQLNKVGFSLVLGKEVRPLREVTVKGGPDSWETVELSIPPSLDPVRPWRLRISPPRGSPVVIKDLTVQRVDDSIWLIRALHRLRQ